MEELKKLLDQLTFEEKAALLTGTGDMTAGCVDRLGVPERLFSDGPHGVRMAGVTDAVHFPSLCCAGASWDEGLMERYGEAVAEECIRRGVSMILAPGVNLKRNILCGRNFEYLSEDPLIAGKLGAAYIRGVQKKGVAACLKHFAVNNQEVHRCTLNVEVDERTLREIYLRAFEIAVKEAQPEGVMCAYNKVNAIWCAEHRQLLTEILREEWGYGGLLVSDWGAVQDVVRSICAGLDLIMPMEDGVTEKLRSGLAQGQISMEEIDQAVLRVLRFLMQPREGDMPCRDRSALHELAREIAAGGTVLLKNAHQALPLTAEKYSRIAVVGGYAEAPLINGQGAADVYTDAAYIDQPLAALRARLPQCEVKYWKGFDKLSHSATMLWPTMEAYEAFIDDCDAVVVFAGVMVSEDTENFDRQHAYLNPNQSMFIEHAAEKGKRVIVVLQSGSAVILPAWKDQVDAIVQMWLGGEAAGSAIADVLTGRVNPCGRLTETFPACERRDLTYDPKTRILPYDEKLMVGYRYYDAHPDEIVYPFGHGLSYTDFAYAGMQAEWHGDELTVTLQVANTGSTDGAEIVQLYVHDPVSTVSKPEKALVAFTKVHLRAGESEWVRFELTARDLAYYNTALHAWVLEPGAYCFLAGASSRDIRLTCEAAYTERGPYTLSATAGARLG